MNKYLDSIGLAHLWSLITSKFSPSSETYGNTTNNIINQEGSVGASMEKENGTAFIGVIDDGETSKITLSNTDSDDVGSRIIVENDKIYYVSKENQQNGAYPSDYNNNEIATRADLEKISIGEIAVISNEEIDRICK